MPLLGEVPAARKRPSELGRELEEQFKHRGFVVAPSVSVAIEETAPLRVTFVGEILVPAASGSKGQPASCKESPTPAASPNSRARAAFSWCARPPPGGQVQRIRFRYNDLVGGEPHASAFRLRTGDVVVVE